MTDFTSVPTVELLTRAADAAGKAGVAADLFGPMRSWTEFLKQLRSYMPLGRRDTQILAASGPDHWRAVETLLRTMLQLHGPVIEPDTVLTGGFRIPGSTICPVCRLQFGRNGCDTLQDLRPLAEQVLQHLGDTE